MGGMSSLTGGGGLSASGGDATATNGDSSYGGKSYAGVNFGGSQKPSGLSISPVVSVGVIVVIAIFLLNKK